MIILWNGISFNLPSLALFFRLDPKKKRGINNPALFDRVFISNIGENMMGGERRGNNEDFGELSYLFSPITINGWWWGRGVQNIFKG